MPNAQGVRALPWKRILHVARVLLEEVPPKDRKFLRQFLAKSKGDPRRLTSDERAEVVRILRAIDWTKVRNVVAHDAVMSRILRR